MKTPVAGPPVPDSDRAVSQQPAPPAAPEAEIVTGDTSPRVARGTQSPATVDTATAPQTPPETNPDSAQTEAEKPADEEAPARRRIAPFILTLLTSSS